MGCIVLRVAYVQLRMGRKTLWEVKNESPHNAVGSSHKRQETLMQRRTLAAASAALLTALATWTVPAHAQSGEIRIAQIHSKTGPLEAYAKQSNVGLMMGLAYATGGTMTVAGKKIVVI